MLMGRGAPTLLDQTLTARLAPPGRHLLGSRARSTSRQTLPSSPSGALAANRGGLPEAAEKWGKRCRCVKAPQRLRSLSSPHAHGAPRSHLPKSEVACISSITFNHRPAQAAVESGLVPPTHVVSSLPTETLPAAGNGASSVSPAVTSRVGPGNPKA